MITLETLFEASWIIGGLWVDSKLCWMVIYEIRCKGNGIKYLRGELRRSKK